MWTEKKLKRQKLRRNKNADQLKRTLVSCTDVVKVEASTIKAKACTFEAKVIGPDAKAFKHH